MTNSSRALLILLATLPLAADPVADVRSALSRLGARDPIRATYDVHRSVASEGKFQNEKYAGKVTVELQGDNAGFHIIFPRPTLDQAVREQQAQAKNTKATTPTVSALKGLEPVETSTAIDFAPVLNRMLETAKLVSDTNGTWAGKPARVMIFRLADEAYDGPAKMKAVENKLTLWLGADLVPLAAEQIDHIRLSFLFIKGETRQKRSWHLTRLGDRLVAARQESTRSGSGMGQKGSSTVVATLRVH